MRYILRIHFPVEHAFDPEKTMAPSIDEPPLIVGPFGTLIGAQSEARNFRLEHPEDFPLEDGRLNPTGDNNDNWTERGWYFGIHELVERGKIDEALGKSE